MTIRGQLGSKNNFVNTKSNTNFHSVTSAVFIAAVFYACYTNSYILFYLIVHIGVLHTKHCSAKRKKKCPPLLTQLIRCYSLTADFPKTQM